MKDNFVIALDAPTSFRKREVPAEMDALDMPE